MWIRKQLHDKQGRHLSELKKSYMSYVKLKKGISDDMGTNSASSV